MAQDEVIADIAAICPWILYPKVSYANMPTCTTTDYQIFTFGTDANGYAISPMGSTKIFTSLNDIPDSPWVEGVDYLNEGTQIRIPNNNTYSGTLYWRGITPPGPISGSASQQPALFPEASRELIALRYAYNFGTEGNRFPDLSDAMAIRYGYPLTNSPGRFAFWCTSWRKAFSSGGALGGISGMQLAIAGSPLNGSP